ncbi:unnamed protein product, partial [Vitis vinifera]
MGMESLVGSHSIERLWVLVRVMRIFALMSVLQRHPGPCPPCKAFAPPQLCPSEEKFTCEKPCGRKKNCGRHCCSERCCPLSNSGNVLSGDWDPHLCSMTCGKKLRCGQHSCENLCHSGHCPPCLETIFIDLTCACGRTSIAPPLPCGTPTPSCQHPCSIPQPCGHLSSHNCHFGDCPPYSILIAKECIGGHVVLKNIPCGSMDIRCNKLCSKTKQCGMHACRRTCHPSCDSSYASGSGLKSSCGQTCGASRRDCRHTCIAPCHPSSLCPDSRCDFPVTITCSCGRISATVPCDAGGSSVGRNAGMIIKKDISLLQIYQKSGQNPSILHTTPCLLHTQTQYASQTRRKMALSTTLFRFPPIPLQQFHHTSSTKRLLYPRISPQFPKMPLTAKALPNPVPGFRGAVSEAIALIQSSPATWKSALLNNFLIFIAGAPILVSGLSLSGIAAAFLLGTLTWRAFGSPGFLLVATYFVIGTAATKVKMAQKEAQGVAEKRKGRRGPGSVIGSSAAGCVCAFLSIYGVGGEAFLQLWQLGFVASFCTKLSDTVSSEIGKAYGKTTYLVTTLKIVPRGTEGAVSAEGTSAGLLASILLAFVGCLMGQIDAVEAVICVVAAQIANLGESFIGAALQGKEGFRWLNNDVVNVINISMGSILAILIQKILRGF